MLPYVVSICPACGNGVRPARGWTWIRSSALFGPGANRHGEPVHDRACPLTHPVLMGGKSGLLWIGERYYPSPADFSQEAQALGVSRRIRVVPRGFEIGKTWVLLAHGKGHAEVGEQGIRLHRAVVFVFQPTSVEYVVTGRESEAELTDLQRKGVNPVRVVPVKEDDVPGGDPQLRIDPTQEEE